MDLLNRVCGVALGSLTSAWEHNSVDPNDQGGRHVAQEVKRDGW